jgi:glycosyltransferase involved in cell wall biosynthesis
MERGTAEAAAEFRRQFGLFLSEAAAGEVIFSLIGRVTRSKGHFDLVEALRQLPQGLPPCRFLIVGEGSDRAALEKLVARHGLGRLVTFCGFQGNVPAVTRASDVVLLPSHREPFAITILEAMFSARPLLVSNSGGTPEAVTDGREGLIFPVRDAAALAQGIARLATDAGLRRQMGEQGLRTAHERFLLSMMLDATEARYRQLAATPAGAPAGR